ncbi:hypothetical protein [Paenibacillus humicus]|uniref:hypothetical protein n=1 Tax=Paenibacillus humicus TaxID=412861 RepID=UPI001C3FAA22|nr:hypothetical protein [Paenibacillus humicus]
MNIHTMANRAEQNRDVMDVSPVMPERAFGSNHACSAAETHGISLLELPLAYTFLASVSSQQVWKLYSMRHRIIPAPSAAPLPLNSAQSGLGGGTSVGESGIGPGSDGKSGISGTG